jgi:HK97 family phage major capsid protein
VELAQDSANISQILQRSLVQALATAIDRAGLVGDGSANSPTGVLHFGDRNVVSVGGALTSYDKFLDGIGALLNSNVDLERVGSIIIGPHAWKDLAKLKTGIASDKTTLQKPPALTQPFLVTTAAETSSGSPLTYASTGFVADWQDLFYGIRRDITVRILDQAYFGSNLTLAVTAYARVDFAGAREESFTTLEGITH